VLIQRELKKYGCDIKSIEQPFYSIHKKDPNDFWVNGLMELLDQYQRLEIVLSNFESSFPSAEWGRIEWEKMSNHEYS
jgi:hypothetical protein